MDLSQMKVTNTNMINVTDSLEAPLLKLNVKSVTGTVAPVDETLLFVYVDKQATETQDRKTFAFQLDSALGTGDEFILEPVVKGTKVTLNAKVVRSDNTVEEVTPEAVVLFEGTNYISTNYTDAQIDVVYPKDSDLVKLFLSNVIYTSKNVEGITLDDIYFKDCFTEVEAGINAEFNKVTMKCFDSTNQTFSMDCEGNLVVNSITTTIPIETHLQNAETLAIVDVVYPVGSYYETSDQNFNPNVSWGGNWVEDTSGRILIALDNSQTEFNKVGNTGGSKTHNHTLRGTGFADIGTSTGSLYSSRAWGGSIKNQRTTGISHDSGSWNDNTSSNLTGTTGVTSNLQPYIIVKRWHRIA